MKLKAVSGIMLTLLLIDMFTLAFNVQPAKAEPATWTVDDDGPADFSSIQEAINAASAGDTIYVYNGTYYEHVVVNKSVALIGDEIIKPTINTIGTPPPISNGSKSTVHISADDVTVSGFVIQNSVYDWGIFLNHSSNSIVNGNIVKSEIAILVDKGSGNNILDNIIEQTQDGACVFYGLEIRTSDNNVVTGNDFTIGCHIALKMGQSDHNHIAFNTMYSHLLETIVITGSHNNSIVCNTICRDPIVPYVSLRGSYGNVFHNNTFLSNGWDITIVIDDSSKNNTWDDGYPSGGNYWGDYAGVDLYSGPYQNLTGSDGIGDTEYVINAENIDHYPLMEPYGGPPGIGITSVTTSKTIIAPGHSLGVNITIMNYGVDTETFNVTAYANTTIIDTLTNITLTNRNSTTVTITWNTTGVAYGTLVRISTNVTQVPRETYLDDNTYVDGWVVVAIEGDVDLNGEINVLDSLMLLIIRTLGKTVEEEPSADVNCDGSIDVLDSLMLLIIRILAA